MYEVVRLAKISSVSEDTVSVSEVEVDESSKISHNDLLDRDLEQQHPIESIIGLSEELDKLNKLKNIESKDRGVAQYHEWSSNYEYPQSEVDGYFVSLVDGTDTIKICTSKSEDVFGVTVDASAIGLVGGKYDAMIQQEIMPDSTEYGLVCNSGKVKVRRQSDVEIGDYVIPNVLGQAKRSEAANPVQKSYFQVIEIKSGITVYSLTYNPINKPIVNLIENDSLGAKVVIGKEASGTIIAWDEAQITVDIGEGGYSVGDKLCFMYKYEIDEGGGYKVTAVSYENGVHYAFIDLSASSSALARMQDELNDLSHRVSVVEGNVITALNKANAAYDKANGGSGDSWGDIEDDTGSGSGGDISAEIAERLQQIEESMAETREIVNEKSEAIDSAVGEVNEIKEKFEPFDTWTDDQGNTGASYFVRYVNDENIKTNAAIESMEGEIGEANTAIMQNALSLQSVANVVRKYSVGERSQAYGLTFEEALDVLQEGYIYVPYLNGVGSTTETYATADGNSKVVTFFEHFSYRWSSDGWVQETEDENVMCYSEYIPGSSGMQYWFLTSEVDIVHEEITYPKETLYLWTGNTWVAVASLAENSIARAASLINQKANEISLSVKGLSGDLATVQTQVKDNAARIDLIAASQGDAEALASIKMKSDQNAAEIEYLTSFGCEIIKYDEITEKPTTGTFYVNKPSWDFDNEVWSFAGNTASFDMATNEYRYAENASNTKTYYEYKCLELNKWRRLLIGRAQSIAAIQQKADANESSIASINEWKSGANQSIASILQKSNANEANITSLAQWKNNTTTSMANIEQRVSANESAIETLSKWEGGDNTSSLASLTQKVNENEANIQSLTEWKDETSSSLTSIEQKADNNEASISSLTEWKQDTTSSIANIAQRVSNNEATIETLTKWEGGDGASSLAEIVQRVGDNEASINSLTELIEGNTTSIANVSQKATTNEANITSLTEWKGETSESLTSIEQKVDSNEAKIETWTKWKDDYSEGAVTAASWVNTNGANVTETVSWTNNNKESLIETKNWVDTNGANVETLVQWKNENGDNLISSLIGTTSTANANKAELSNLASWRDETTVNLAEIVTKASNNETSITQMVKELGEDGVITAASIATKISEDESSIEMIADKIDLSGYVTFSGLSEGTTTIDGSCIKTGQIDAEIIEVDDLSAICATIGGNTINDEGLQITNGSIALGSDFKVTSDGKVTAKSGKIGGFNIDSSSISSGTAGYAGSVLLSTSNETATIAGTTLGYWRMTIGDSFGVTNTGKLYASGAKISGQITATSGAIGELTIENNNIVGTNFKIGSSGITFINTTSLKPSSVLGGSNNGLLVQGAMQISGNLYLSSSNSIVISSQTAKSTSVVIKDSMGGGKMTLTFTNGLLTDAQTSAM